MSDRLSQIPGILGHRGFRHPLRYKHTCVDTQFKSGKKKSPYSGQIATNPFRQMTPYEPPPPSKNIIINQFNTRRNFRCDGPITKADLLIFQLHIGHHSSNLKDDRKTFS